MRAATSTTVPVSSPVNMGPDVGRVPAPAGVRRCAESDPASARTNRIGRKRPNSMQTPSADWNQSLVTVRPPNALPLLLDADANAYSTSVKPWMDCGVPGSPLLPRYPTVEPRMTVMPVPIRTRAGITSTDSAASVISRCPSFLPRCSGVRPTSRPPTNTAMRARTRMPYRPVPTPPGAISPSSMFSSTAPPPSGDILSCAEFTAPVLVPVVATANSADPGIPKRTSLPSIIDPAAVAAAPRAPDSAASVTASRPKNSVDITARRVRPCRRSPTSVPNVRVRLTGISRIARISTMFVIGVGFSNGCAELAARMPPPLVPSSLIASCEATGASAFVTVVPSSPVDEKPSGTTGSRPGSAGSTLSRRRRAAGCAGHRG